MPLSNPLSCSIQHILNKNPIPHGWVVYQHMDVWMIPTKAPSDEGAVSQTGCLGERMSIPFSLPPSALWAATSLIRGRL